MRRLRRLSRSIGWGGVAKAAQAIVRKRIYERYFWKPKVARGKRILTRPDFSIISCNCIGGAVYHDLGLQFRTPTINLFMEAGDFVRFCEDISRYLTLELCELESAHPYPLGALDDLTLHLVHYPDFANAQAKWNERRGRVDPSNLFLVFTDRDGFTEQLLPRIDAIPASKVLFSSRRMEQFSWTCHFPEYQKDGQVGDLTELANFRGKRRYEVRFDFIKWLNGLSVSESTRQPRPRFSMASSPLLWRGLRPLLEARSRTKLGQPLLATDS